jgi:Kef-type K+ transport system membrane component KefB
MRISRIQLILAEKKTTLAAMRTGIGVFTIPLSVVTVLVATSRDYDVLETYHLLLPLLGVCAGLVVLGIYLVHRSVRRIGRQDALINRIKQQDPGLAEFYGGQL